MSSDDFRQWPTPESTGIDKGYRKDRAKALADLDAQLAGPKHPGIPEPGVKNPDGAFENPAPFTGLTRVDDSAGDVDPQGQQGGTHGGQPAEPALSNEVHPLANQAERPSQDRKSSV